MIAELHPVFDWLFAAKAGADSALCSVAFSINSGAASIDGVRFQVYDRIQRRISDRVGKVDESEWLARIEAMPDTSPEKAAFMLRYNELLDCFIQAKTRFSRENLEKGRLAKFVMSVAAVLSVVCIAEPPSCCSCRFRLSVSGTSVRIWLQHGHSAGNPEKFAVRLKRRSGGLPGLSRQSAI